MNRKFFIDPFIFSSILTLCFFGLFILYSASQGNTTLIIKQSVFGIIGVLLFFIISQPDPDLYRRFAPLVLIIAMALSLVAYFFGPEINGAKRWIKVASFSFQPSELLKLSLPLFLAAFLHDKKLPISLKETLISLFIIIICFLIVSSQPDLGTALIIGAAGLFVLFLAGLSWVFIGTSFAAMIICSPYIWNNLLEPFQKARIATLLNPDADPTGSGWNIMQSKIAIGSGGLSGKGYGQGSQTHLDFLPETQTDFIFSVLAEELGFIGVLILAFIYIFIILRCFYLAVNARDRFCRLVIGGFLFTFALNVTINLCMVVGLVPVVGMPLPFLSQGGTSLLSIFIMFGIITSMATHKHLLQK